MKKALILAICLCLMLVSCKPSSESDEFTYKVIPGTEEWNNLSNTEEMYDACQVPSEVIENASTEQLVNIVLDNPMISNILVFDDKEEAVDLMRSELNVLNALLLRDDLIKTLDYYHNNPNRFFSEDTDEDIVRKAVFDYIYEYCKAYLEL